MTIYPPISGYRFTMTIDGHPGRGPPRPAANTLGQHTPRFSPLGAPPRGRVLHTIRGSHGGRKPHSCVPGEPREVFHTKGDQSMQCTCSAGQPECAACVAWARQETRRLRTAARRRRWARRHPAQVKATGAAYRLRVKLDAERSARREAYMVQYRQVHAERLRRLDHVRQRRYYAAHREQIIARVRRYNVTHRARRLPHQREAQRRYYARHREAIRDKAKAYDAEHRVETNARHSRYYAAHRERINAQRRAKRQAARLEGGAAAAQGDLMCIEMSLTKRQLAAVKRRLSSERQADEAPEPRGCVVCGVAATNSGLLCPACQVCATALLARLRAGGRFLEQTDEHP